MTPADFSRLLADPQHAGVCAISREQLNNDADAMMRGAGDAGCLVQRVDLRRVRNKVELLAALGKALRFPEWFGQNWDALEDCLRDMGWQPALGYVTILEHCDALQARAADDLATLIDIFKTVADDWRGKGVPFWCLVELESGDLGLPQFATLAADDGL